MRILYLSQYFPPEVGATQTRAFEMARGFVAQGHQVTMIAEVPNHPSGIISPEYRGKLFKRSQEEGIEVIRVWVKASPVKTFLTRMAFYLSYMFMAALAGVLLARGRFDVIYATSPPLFVGVAGWILSHFRRLPFVFEVRDLWPESAVAMGELQSSAAIAWATRAEEACYRRARRIVVATNGIRERLLQRGIAAAQLAFIPNGANTTLFQPQPELGRKRRAELILNGKFVVLYAGILGVAQGMETIVTAAQILAEHRDIHFLLIGAGPKQAELAASKERLRLTNLTLLGERPQREMPANFSAADVALVPLRKLELFQGALPSKMFEAWACACPVLLSVNGEAKAVLEQAQAGVHVEPEDAAGLAAAILQLKNSEGAGRLLGENGRRFVVAHYSRQVQSQRLAQLLREVIEEKNSRDEHFRMSTF